MSRKDRKKNKKHEHEKIKGKTRGDNRSPSPRDTDSGGSSGSVVSSRTRIRAVYSNDGSSRPALRINGKETNLRDHKAIAELHQETLRRAPRDRDADAPKPPFPREIRIDRDAREDDAQMESFVKSLLDLENSRGDTEYIIGNESTDDQGNTTYEIVESDASYWAKELGTSVQKIKDFARDRGNEIDGDYSEDMETRKDNMKSNLRGKSLKDAFSDWEREIALSGVSGGSSDWALGSIIRSRNEVMERLPKDVQEEYFPGKDPPTIHHKISRINLENLAAAMEAELKKNPRSEANKLKEVIDRIRDYLNAPDSTNKKVLHNMPANLEIGPSAGVVVGDPGMAFDGSRLSSKPSGAPWTPMSDALNTANTEIERGNITGRYDWKKIANNLDKAHTRHVGTYGEQKIPTPKYTQWKKTGKKNKQGIPLMERGSVDG